MTVRSGTRTGTPSRGRIVTFFSYKGGVGRTMAVANVGFTAAMSGLRVLLMDWDLEAPGLSYYFRGLIDHEGAGEIRRAPGVLNLFWDWEHSIAQAQSISALTSAMRPFKTGKAIKACIRPLVQPTRLPAGGALDVIGAGSTIVRIPQPTSYANALSQFNWSAFFEERAGGVMIEALRDWCRKHYDLILIDSRTGLADIAGICTMQLPDEVILCFVLNRQNMEGVAQVAAAIIKQRGSEVTVRVSPMRVSKERPTEEADARARAQREFRRAQLPSDRIEVDMARLAVPAATNVPFYETLAPFAASDELLDPLTLAYLGLTQELLGRELPRVKIDPTWAGEVRRRLEPRVTTIEYLRSLETADPDRASEELERYLDGALDADPSLELDRDYVNALVGATFDWLNKGLELAEASQQLIASKAIALLKQLHLVGEGDWRIEYVDALEQYEMHFPTDNAVGIGDYRERDEILTQGVQTLAVLMRRVELRTMVARFTLTERPADALSIADEADELLGQASSLAGIEAQQSLALSHATIAFVRMQAFLKIAPQSARAQAELVLDYAKQGEDNITARVMVAEAHLRLGMMPDPPLPPIEHLMEAIAAYPRTIVRDVERFEWATKIIVSQEHASDLALQFLEAIVGHRTNWLISFSRTTKSMIKFAESARQLIMAIHDAEDDRTRRVLSDFAESCRRILQQWTVRIGMALRAGRRDQSAIIVATAYQNLAETLVAAGLSKKSLQRLYDALHKIDPARSPLE